MRGFAPGHKCHGRLAVAALEETDTQHTQHTQRTQHKGSITQADPEPLGIQGSGFLEYAWTPQGHVPPQAVACTTRHCSGTTGTSACWFLGIQRVLASLPEREAGVKDGCVTGLVLYNRKIVLSFFQRKQICGRLLNRALSQTECVYPG